MGTERTCTACDYCGMDMDLDPYCVETKTLALVTEETGQKYPVGLYLRHARPKCKGDNWEPRRERT